MVQRGRGKVDAHFTGTMYEIHVHRNVQCASVSPPLCVYVFVCSKTVNNTRIAVNITKYLFFVTIIQCVHEYLVSYLCGAVWSLQNAFSMCIICIYWVCLCANIIKFRFFPLCAPFAHSFCFLSLSLSLFHTFSLLFLFWYCVSRDVHIVAANVTAVVAMFNISMCLNENANEPSIHAQTKLGCYCVHRLFMYQYFFVHAVVLRLCSIAIKFKWYEAEVAIERMKKTGERVDTGHGYVSEHCDSE